MNKNALKNSEYKHPYKIDDSLAAKFTFKRKSNNRRVHTEAYDPA